LTYWKKVKRKNSNMGNNYKQSLVLIIQIVTNLKKIDVKFWLIASWQKINTKMAKSEKFLVGWSIISLCKLLCCQQLDEKIGLIYILKRIFCFLAESNHHTFKIKNLSEASVFVFHTSAFSRSASGPTRCIHLQIHAPISNT